MQITRHYAEDNGFDAVDEYLPGHVTRTTPSTGSGKSAKKGINELVLWVNYVNLIGITFYDEKY